TPPDSPNRGYSRPATGLERPRPGRSAKGRGARRCPCGRAAPPQARACPFRRQRKRIGRCSEESLPVSSVAGLGGGLRVAARGRPRVLWPRQTEIFPQGCALIGRAEHAAALQLGDDELDEVVEGGGKVWRQDVEAVCSLVLEPELQHVGYLHGGANYGEVTARCCDPLVELADREIVLVGDLPDQRLPALHAFRGGKGRQRPVERKAFEVQRSAGEP